MTDEQKRRAVILWIGRLIEYGKGAADSVLDDMSMGEVADAIIAEVEQ